MPELSRVFSAAVELQLFCEEQAYDFCFIGGLALQRWGEPRLTRDADVSLLTGFGNEERYVDALLNHFEPSREEARQIALVHRVLYIQASNGIHLDVALAAIPFEEACIVRASIWEPGDQVRVRTCSAEDLIVHKAFADRGKDWVDIEGILIRQGSGLKFSQIISDLSQFTESMERPDILVRLRTLAAKYGVR